MSDKRSKFQVLQPSKEPQPGHQTIEEVCLTCQQTPASGIREKALQESERPATEKYEPDTLV